MPRTIEGSYRASPDAAFAVLVTRFNHFITDRLQEGAIDCLVRHGVGDAKIQVFKVPGAFEAPLVAKRLAESKQFAAVIVLGAVIRGSTSHYDLVAGEVAKGCGQAMMGSGVPVVFGVLTTDTIEQAIDRAGTKAGNKGWEAALTALEMADLLRQL